MLDRKITIKLRLSLLLFLGHCVFQSRGEWFPGNFAFDNLGLSDNCLAAVNATVSSCPGWLPDYVSGGYAFTAACKGASFELLPSDVLTSLCEPSCAEDLEATRTAIKGACTADTDVFVLGRDIAYPGMLMVMQHRNF